MSLRSHNSYRESGAKWLAKLPSSWQEKRLRHVIRIQKRIAGELGHQVLSITQKGIRIKDTESNEGQVSQDYSKYQLVEPGDYAMNHMDLLTGYIDQAQVYGVTSPDYRVFTLREGEQVNEKYLLRVLQNAYLQRIFYAYGQGSSQLGRWRLPTDGFLDFVIPVPPLDEQVAVANFLDRETAKIDALIGEQQRLIELLQEKRQAVISHAVTKGLNPNAPMKDSGVEWLGEVPEHWETAAVGHRYSVQLGKMLDANQQTGNHNKPYLRVADVQWGVINTDDLPEMDFPPEAEARYRLKAGDLLVNEGGSYVGRSAIWSAPLEECYYQKALHRLRAYDATKDYPLFMYWLMEYATRLGVFIAGGNQTTIDHLTAEQLRRYRFAFPPMQEQEVIANHLRLKTESLQRLTTQAESMVGVLQERRQALISAAVTGQIDVRGLVTEAVAQ